MVLPHQAAVKPRVLSPETGDRIVLDEAIRSLIETSSHGAIEIVGERGAGKTTSLQHLAAILSPHHHIVLLDEPETGRVLVESAQQWVIFTTINRTQDLSKVSLSLTPWSDDDLIEYLLASHPTCCASVMRRIQVDDFRRRILGHPQLWRIILDEMAHDESIESIRVALRLGLARMILDEDDLRQCHSFCFASLQENVNLAAEKFAELTQSVCTPELLRALRHRTVQVVLGAEHVVDRLNRSSGREFPSELLSRDLVEEIADLAKLNKQIVTHLENILNGGEKEFHSMAVSILHATGIPWRPTSGQPTVLSGAFLDAARWVDVDLSHAELAAASLNRADLSRANLDRANLKESHLRRACLRSGHLECVEAENADLTGANLTNVAAKFILLREALLRNANLEGADLEGANLTSSDLSDSCFRRANLSNADLLEAKLDDADFTDADLGHAKLDHLNLREACFEGAKFTRSHLRQCDLEYVNLPDANFEGADLSNAWLTGSVMPGANFGHASLQGAGLADVEWEEANLRNADLRGCSFHMGSSRSGLVDSPYPCHGSRTGFYTDTFDEQYFKYPEEIRKANLCGADLRGAMIRDVDFYLVDLRGAIYDSDQERHFRRCDAILEDRQ